MGVTGEAGSEGKVWGGCSKVVVFGELEALPYCVDPPTDEGVIEPT